MFHGYFGRVGIVRAAVRSNSSRPIRAPWIDFWHYSRCLRFAVSIAGGDTTGLQERVPIKHDRDESRIDTMERCSGCFKANRENIMDSPQYSSGHTSNDLLFSLDGGRSRRSLNYEIVAQSAEEVQDTKNAPAVSMGSYLIESGQTQLLTTISIYSERGESREQVRLLYMNAVALRVWRAMGKKPSVIGAQHRPSRTALLAFGVPFSE